MEKDHGIGPVWRKKPDNQVVDSSGEAYLIEEIGLGNLPGWRIVDLYSLRAIYGKIVDPLVGKTGYVALLLCLLVVGAVIFLYVMAQKDIRSRRHAEQRLESSVSLLYSTLESTADGILVVDRKGKITAFNQRFLTMWQIPKDIMESRDDDRAIAIVLDQLSDPQAFLEKVKYLYGRPEEESFDLIEFKDGKTFERYSHPQKIAESVVGRVWSFRDVTERKMFMDILNMEKQRFQKLAENVPLGMVIIQPDGSFSYANPKFKEMFGYELSDVPNGREWFRKVFPDPGYRHEAISAWIQDFKDVAQGETRPRVFSVITKDGIEKTIHFRPMKLVSGEDLMTCEDITDRKRAEVELRQSEERYRSLVEDSFDGIFIQKGPKIIFANSRLYEMLGYFPGELEGMDHWLVYHPDYREITRRRAIARMNGEEVTPRYEVMLQKKDGLSFLAEISARPVQVDGQSGIKVWIRDISGQRRSEEAQRRMAAAIEQSIESVMITDRNGKIQYINPAFEHISGYRKEEVIGRDTRFLKSDSLDSSHYKDLLTAIRAGKPWKGRLLSQRKDGRIFYEDVAISPVHDSSGEIVNFVDVGHDVTENVELQMQLLQAQKMESLGILAGGIAHDFNNLLQVVLGYSEFMLQRKKEGEPDYDGLKKIYQAGKRGADLVQSLLTFSRKVETKYVPVNLNQEIIQVQRLLSRTIPKTIKIDLHLGGDLESIKADPSQVGQVLMNLGVNARDAMPNGGILTIETANVRLDKEYCSSHLDATPGNYVLLTISDTGQGMDKKTLSHIFEPFFSTKEKGKGTGLGLATVYGIVKQHDGRIMCFSEPGHGTRFKIYLPAIQAEEITETPPNELAILGGTETVLLVDDDDVVRDLGATLLVDFGYKVIAASNGKEALEIYHREGERISLIILDLIMPEMDGMKCLAEVLRVNPKAKVIIASGYSESGSGSGAMARGAKGYVPKPYNIRQLLNAIREILDNNLPETDHT